MSGAARRNLVVVRAGRDSLHPRWLEGAAGRTWDLVVSLYDPGAAFVHGPDVRVVVRPGGKWDGIHALFDGSALLDRYDRVWLPDDDIDATCADIEAVFAASRAYGLDVCQPSLTRDSYYSHFALLSCPGFRLRYVNFVEIMAPCLAASLLRKVLPDMAGSMSGFGLDYVWGRLADDPLRKAAILDSVAVRHTRPVGRALRSTMARAGVSAHAEEAALKARYGVEGRIRPLAYAAVDGDGRRIDGGARLGALMALRYLGARREFGGRQSPLPKIVQLVRRQLTRTADLSRLRRRGDPAGDEALVGEAPT